MSNYGREGTREAREYLRAFIDGEAFDRTAAHKALATLEAERDALIMRAVGMASNCLGARDCEVFFTDDDGLCTDENPHCKRCREGIKEKLLGGDTE